MSNSVSLTQSLTAMQHSGCGRITLLHEWGDHVDLYADISDLYNTKFPIQNLNLLRTLTSVTSEENRRTRMKKS